MPPLRSGSGMTRAGAFLACVLLAAPAARAQEGTWSAARTLCTIADGAVNEASGIAMSRRQPGIFYVHNDSGDSARFWAVSKSGQTVATINITNAAAVDWEDMAVGYDKDCVPTVYLADIGDNGRQRPEVVIYAVPEPDLSQAGTGKTISVTARALRFRYPDGPHDAETLMADWQGRALYVVSKENGTAPSTVYRLEPTWDAGTQTAVNVGAMTFADPFPIGQNRATGGDIAPDGSRMVVRTYFQAYEWRIPKGKAPEAALATAPTVIRLQLENQGEAICYGLNGKTLLTTSEQRPTPVLMYQWTPKPTPTKTAAPSGATKGKQRG